MGLKNDKDLIRNKIIKERDKLSEEYIRHQSQKILEAIKHNFIGKSYKNYMTYVGIDKEVDTKEIIKLLLSYDKNVSVPICAPKDRALLPSQIYDLNELAPSYFNLLEPKEGYVREIDPREIEIVLVPGLAFDRDGNRLGYGKGYYDRFLKKTRPEAIKIALAFEFQIIDRVPVGPFDFVLDMIITDREIIIVEQ